MLHPRHHHSHKPPPPMILSNAEYMRKSACMRNAAVYALLVLQVFTTIMFALLLWGASSTTGTMDEMRRATGYMQRVMNETQGNLVAYGRSLLADYPEDQDRVLVSQVLGTVSNVHRITSRVYEVLTVAGEEQVSALLDQIQKTLAQINSRMASVSGEDIQHLKQGTIETLDAARTITTQLADSGLVNHVAEVANAVRPQDVAALLAIAQGLDVDDLGRLLAGVQDLVSHVDRIAEQVESDDLVTKVDQAVVSLDGILGHLQETRKVELKF